MRPFRIKKQYSFEEKSILEQKPSHSPTGWSVGTLGEGAGYAFGYGTSEEALPPAPVHSKAGVWKTDEKIYKRFAVSSMNKRYLMAVLFVACLVGLGGYAVVELMLADGGDKGSTTTFNNVNTTACSTAPGQDVGVSSGPTKLGLSGKGQVCVLMDGDDSIVGRSYDGKNWEQSATGEYLFDCSEGTFCKTILSTSGDFILKTYGTSVNNAKNEIARLLTQATFGPTKAEIDGFRGTPKAWIEEQISLPATLHRLEFRRRVSPAAHRPDRAGRGRSACERGSRWVHFAFTSRDVNKQAVITKAGGVVTVSIDGFPRTRVPEADWREALNLSPVTICNVREEPGKTVVVAKNCRGGRKINLKNINLNLPNANIAPNRRISLPAGASLVEMAARAGGVKILRHNAPTLPACNEPASGAFFLRDRDNKLYHHDKRLLLLANTVENPARGYTGNIECPNVIKNFVNIEGCVIGGRACNPDENSVVADQDNLVEICGSPGEIGNQPEFGNRFYYARTSGQQILRRLDNSVDFKSGSTGKKQMVWNRIAMQAPDQLRQRVAFALSQITVITFQQVGLVEAEFFLSYYDIYVRHAFGNYRDVLKEVTFHPMMGRMLTFLNNVALQASFARFRQIIFPDENYAREIMQLFSVGLVQLNMDGSSRRTPEGAPLQTYTNDDIMTFSRIFTGFRFQAPRSNVEGNSNRNAQNNIDPMRLDPDVRDVFPKMDLYKGHIGDGYPLCSDLPPRMFLRKGATYSYIGRSSKPKIIEEDENAFGNAGTKRVVLNPASALYKELCKASGGRCRYSSQVVLPRNLVCNGVECKLDAPRAVKVGNAFYEYVRPACVRFPFLKDGVKITKNNKREAMCVEKQTKSASPACCDGARNAIQFCEFHGERVSFAHGQARCQANGRTLCNWNRLDSRCTNLGYFWTNQRCSVDFKVREDGLIAVVHKPGGGNVYNIIGPNNINFFRVKWEGEIPKPSNDCLGICTKAGDVCNCGVKVEESAVFTAMPDSTQAKAELRIGSLPPDVHGGYSMVRDEGGVKLWALARTAPFSQTSIFEIQVHGKRKFFRNKRSMVFSARANKPLFRNPANLMNLVESTIRDGHYEVDALLDHLMDNPSTPPFIAYRMIQRFVSSNPSPRYVEAVATAFATGTYEGIGSGDRGDMAATMAAVLLDQEARNVALDYDPSHGMLREPLLKVTHFIRSLQVAGVQGREIEYKSMVEQIAQEAHAAPNVFNFFLPEFSPAGPVADARLVAPEAQIMTSPRVIGYLNGMISASRFGLTDCFDGFSTNFNQGRRCNTLANANNGRVRAQALANLNWNPTDGVTNTNAVKIVNELDLLLTAGRLQERAKAIIRQQYNIERRENGAIKAMKLVQQLIGTSPEFQVSNQVQRQIGTSRPPQKDLSGGRPYKAIVYLYAAGGLDSFNMLVPHSGCGAKDMYTEYRNVRGDVALAKSALLTIDVPRRNQPCNTFGIHPRLPQVRDLYNDGDALFLANVGPLVQPMTKAELLRGSKPVPDSLFAHNVQTQIAQTLEPLKRENHGVIGRANDVLTQMGFSTGSFSISGKNSALEPRGQISSPQQFMSPNGVRGFNPSMGGALERRINQAMMSLNKDAASSLYAETWGEVYESSVNQTTTLATVLRQNNIPAFKTGSQLGRQFEQVAKLINSRNALKMDRQTFHVQIFGLDTHNDNGGVLNQKFDEVNEAIQKFVAEMKRQKIWNNVLIVQASEFGRTITSNGAGTDHGWGGHYMVMGGGLKGKQILGKYPADITTSSPDYVGRGRFLPSMGWESVWNAILQWYGVSNSKMSEAIPLLDNFRSQLLQRGQMFN